MFELILSKTIVNDFLKHGELDYPNECCGFIIGEILPKGKSIGKEYIPVKNSKTENKERRFLINPVAYQNAEDRADELGLSVISIVHSHPDHPDRPSEFDRNHAWPGFSYIIIAVEKGQVDSFKSWQLNEDRSKFNNEKITILEENKIGK